MEHSLHSVFSWLSSFLVRTRFSAMFIGTVFETLIIRAGEALGAVAVVKTFLVFKQLNRQSSSFFLFTIVDKILQTILVVTTAAPAFQNLASHWNICDRMPDV